MTTREEHYRRVASPKLLQAVRARLRSLGVRTQELSDAAGDVLRELLETRKPPPNDEECLALALHVCEQRVKDRRRKHKRRSKTNVGQTDQADVHALDPRGGDSPEALLFEMEVQELLNAMFRDGSIKERSAEMWRLAQEGLSHVHIAARFGCAPQTVANEVTALRTTLRTKIAALLAGGVSVSLLALWLVVPAVVAFVQRGSRPKVEPIGPDIQLAPPQPSPQERAERLRDDAFRKCADAQWPECERELDEARQLDPAGENTIDVQNARQQLYIELHAPKVPQQDRERKTPKPGDKPPQK